MDYIWAQRKNPISEKDLPHWDALKMECMYVDWMDSRGLVAEPVTADQVEAVLSLTNQLIGQLCVVNTRTIRRQSMRHHHEYEPLVEKFQNTP